MNKSVAALAAAVSAGLLLTGCSSSSQTPASAPAVSSSAGSTTGAASAPSINRVGVAEFERAVQVPGTVVVDVRTPAEFASGHLANAVNIDVEAADFTDQVTKLDPTRTYAVYCRSGNRSQTATTQMAAAGITGIYELEGGINDWVAAGKPVVQ